MSGSYTLGRYSPTLITLGWVWEEQRDNSRPHSWPRLLQLPTLTLLSLPHPFIPTWTVTKALIYSPLSFSASWLTPVLPLGGPGGCYLSQRTLSNKTIKLFLSPSIHVHVASLYLTNGNMVKTSFLCTFTFTTRPISLCIWGWEMGSVIFLLGSSEASKWLLLLLIKILSLLKFLLFDHPPSHLI